MSQIGSHVPTFDQAAGQLVRFGLNGRLRMRRSRTASAVGFDDLPALIPGCDDYRILFSGIVVRADTVIGQASPDGAVELFSVDLDTDIEWS